MSKAIITEQYLHDIADAIIAKGGATAPMTPVQMPAAIAAIPSGGGGANALPIGCPRIDLVQVSSSIDEFYGVVFTDSDSCVVSGICDNFNGGPASMSYAQEVSIGDDGSVVPVGDVSAGRPYTLNMTGKGYHAFRAWDNSGSGFYNGEFSPFRTLKDCVPIAEKGAHVSNKNLIYKCVEGGINVRLLDLRSSYCQILICNKSVIFKRAFFYNRNISYAKVKGVASGNDLEALFSSYNTLLYFADLSELDMSKATSATGTSGSPELVYLRFPPIEKGLRVGLNLSLSTKLSHESLMSVIDSLYNHVTAETGTTPTLTLGSTNLAKLTDVEKQIATDKGWILA